MTIWHFVAVSAFVGALAGFFSKRLVPGLIAGSAGGWLLLALPSLLTMCTDSDLVKANRAAEEFFWSMVFIPACFACVLVSFAASRAVGALVRRRRRSQK